MLRRAIDRVLGEAFLLLQRLLPQHFLMAVVGRIADSRARAVKNALIRGFIRLYGIDTSNLARPVPDGFKSFNDFFTRELADGARPVDPSPATVVSPVDGIVSAAGPIEGEMLLQAKGIRYRLEDLLATDLTDVASYTNGSFATLYLAPYDYHRVHSPVAGELTAARYVPGHLYSVNSITVRLLPRLFTRNERLVCHLRTAVGPMAIIFVGALNVGSVSTPWTGRIRPRKKGVVDNLKLAADTPAAVDKGQLLGWFNMGSTVILLLPPGRCTWHEGLAHGARVTMGQAIGSLAIDDAG